MKKTLFIVIVFCSCTMQKHTQLSNETTAKLMMYARQLQQGKIDTTEFDYLLTFYRK